MNPEKSQIEIGKILSEREEWLLVETATGKSFALRRAEIEIFTESEKLFFGFLDENGFQTWRVENWTFEKGKLHFNLTRNFRRERRKIELVSRVSAAELTNSLELARFEKASRIAGLIVESQPKAKLVRVALNKESGRFAQIVFDNPNGKQTAALADVSGEASPEKLLTTAILWLEKLCNRKKNKVETIWILSEKKTAKDLMKLHALFRRNWQAKIKVYEISRAANSETTLDYLAANFEDLWSGKPKKISAVNSAEMSETAQEIIRLASEEIDVVYTRHGETLRFSGLPFARVRKIFGEEKAWFGTENKRQSLNEKTYDEFTKLIENLKIYRRFDSANKRHAFYTLAPESWLESILRKNIKLLDANLILSPIHNQFRISGDRIDLLALRKDGRLVVIELKTSADREMIFQAADYWREAELQRLSGNLQKAKIFGELQISNESALVYLVAPTLSFHRDFKFLASTVSPEIEIARFDLNENWREDLKVLGRKMI
ncbi:MAG: hypothetical protein ACR2L1_11375 [Pyrinomonadaceae bacterium]